MTLPVDLAPSDVPQIPLDPNDHTSYDLSKLVQTSILEAIDPEVLSHALAQPPFIPASGVLNIRDLGLTPAHNIRPNFLYRAGVLSHATRDGKAKLADPAQYNVKTIVDLRSAEERSNAPEVEIDGVENVWFPSTEEDESGHVRTKAMDYVNGKTGADGFVELYAAVLGTHWKSYKRVLELVRDRPDDGILFHCTAGKDRTGTLAAVLLSLVDTPSEAIASDYALTRVGIEPAREPLMKMIEDMAPKYGSVDAEELSLIGTSKYEVMIKFLDVLQERFGGARGYCKEKLGFSDEDMDKITNNLTRK